MDARRQVQRVAGLGARKRLDGAFALSDLDRVRPRARRRHDPDNEGSGDRADQRETRAEHGQAAFGWTIIRPDISMCRAWQNHWQYHQCTPGRSALKVTDDVSSGEISIMMP